MVIFEGPNRVPFLRDWVDARTDLSIDNRYPYLSVTRSSVPWGCVAGFALLFSFAKPRQIIGAFTFVPTNHNFAASPRSFGASFLFGGVLVATFSFGGGHCGTRAWMDSGWW